MLVRKMFVMFAITAIVFVGSVAIVLGTSVENASAVCRPPATRCEHETPTTTTPPASIPPVTTPPTVPTTTPPATPEVVPETPATPVTPTRKATPHRVTQTAEVPVDVPAPPVAAPVVNNSSCPVAAPVVNHDKPCPTDNGWPWWLLGVAAGLGLLCRKSNAKRAGNAIRVAASNPFVCLAVLGTAGAWAFGALSNPFAWLVIAGLVVGAIAWHRKNSANVDETVDETDETPTPETEKASV